jgi:SAM-dependent methyltransferase
MRPPLFDFRTAKMRQERARRAGGDAFLAREAADGLAERLGAVTRSFTKALWVGQDRPPQFDAYTDDWTKADFDGAEFLAAAPESYDLAVSLFSLQAINDLPGALVQIRRALKPDGLFLAALFGGATLHELRDSFAHAESQTLDGISPRISPFGDARDMGSLLQRAGFALPVADVERTLVRYGDFHNLVRDLRAHGQTNMLAERQKRFLPRRTLAALLAHYQAHHAHGGKLNATFEILYLTGWAPHADQQKPLAPGSARTRLSDALGVPEYSAGEPAANAGPKKPT